MPNTHIPETMSTRRSILTSLAATAAFTAIDGAIPSSLCAAPYLDLDPDWTTPMPPFRIAGNIHYVGSRDLASYLITTPRGHFLINSNLVTSPAQIRASIEKLGLNLHQVKTLLISHAHYDHCAGSAELQRESAAITAPTRPCSSPQRKSTVPSATARQ
jgi:glyoxylase-like metal-dependent hydrolase (beta-lactamase superfamily II)